MASDALAALSGLLSNANNPNGLVQGRIRKERGLVDEERALEMERMFPGRAFAGGSQAQLADDQAQLDESPNFGSAEQARVGAIQQTNDMTQAYQRPEVKSIRDEQERTALNKILAPIALRGQYDVEAAKQAQMGQTARDERLFGNRSAIESGKQQAMSGRADATQDAITLRQRLQALQTGKAHAARPSGLMNWFTGPSQADADQKEIAGLLAQLQGQPGAPAAGGGVVHMVAPNGQPLEVPEHDVAEAEALGARRR